MPLTRKTRLSGSSIVITIPSQLVEAYDINIGDLVEITPLKNDEFIIKKIKMQKPPVSWTGGKSKTTTNTTTKNHSPI